MRRLLEHCFCDADWCEPYAGYHLYYPSRRPPSRCWPMRCAIGGEAERRSGAALELR
jgi:hypothetical protein